MKPPTSAGYDRHQVGHVRRVCLYLATKLGDLLDDLIVVGGLVPSLIVDQGSRVERHVGTLDLDLGMALAVLDDRRYEALADRLKHAGFAPDRNARGQTIRQRWVIDGPPRVSLDFLIPPSRDTDRGGGLRHLRNDLAAIVAPGLGLAFRDRITVPLSGTTIRGEQASRAVWACGPGAFVAMKALSFRSRGENKDAYDLVYLIRNFGKGIEDVSSRLAPLRDDDETMRALSILDEDFSTVNSLGPRRAAEFVHGTRDEAAQADAWSAVRDLLDRLPV